MVSGDALSLEALGSCESRTVALQLPGRQFRFQADGRVTVDGRCLTTAGGNRAAYVRDCTGKKTEKWTIASGQIRDSAGRCLAEVGDTVRTVDCASVSDPRWGFVPVDLDATHRVIGVYLHGNDAPFSNRASLVGEILTFIRDQWASFGITLAEIPDVIDLGPNKPCAELDTLEANEAYAVRELSLTRRYDYVTKYSVAVECVTPDAAYASANVAVFAYWILNNAESQLQVDPNNASDGEMAEVGAFGHELGHLFGLGHENCISGGFQGGPDEGGALQAVEVIPATRGPMCNGAYFPNVAPFAEYQRTRMYAFSCDWIRECSQVPEFGANGTPFGCGYTGFGFVWDATDDVVVVVPQRFTYQEGMLTRLPAVLSPPREFKPDVLAGVRNYYAIGRQDAVAGEPIACGYIDGPPVIPATDADQDGVANADDDCASTPAQTAVNTDGCSGAQRDSDSDGVSDDKDRCPGTATGITVDGRGCGGPPRCDGVAATIVGTRKADRITGTAGRDVIVAGSGGDVIDGNGGADIICAGAGDDTIRTGDEVDSIFAGGGADFVQSGGGADIVDGGPGDDRLDGGAGPDNIRGGGQNDKLFGRAGGDDLYGTSGNDRLVGSGGDDRLNGGNDTDSCSAGLGENIVDACESGGT